MNQHSIFILLSGHWSLERSITSFAGEHLGTFKGQALYKEACLDLLHYREEGRLSTNSCETCAFKDYYFYYNENNIKIYFDLRLKHLFHQIHFNEGVYYPLTAFGVHYCGEDVYNLTYIFESNTDYRVVCSVKGKRKNYVIESRLSKLKGSASF